jgi:hypothetical protein
VSQHLYLDNRDGFGERDFTLFLSEIGKSSHDKNKPATRTFTFVPTGDTSDWVIPARGALVRLEDTRFMSRHPGVRDGVVFTGYVTQDPAPVVLGKAGGTVYGFRCACTSEDYAANLLALPAKTYVNTTRGEIIVDLLMTMFDGLPPYDVSKIFKGGVERLYQVDTGKQFTDIISAFATADSFTYYVIDGHFIYQPEADAFPTSNDTTTKLVIDQSDPRFTADGLKLQPVSTTIKNDITVIGNAEPTTFVREHFISDGYQPFFQLAFLPFGSVGNSLLKDDLTGDTVDTGLWTEVDLPSDYIRPFEGSLNIVGGDGVIGTGSAFLRSRRGLELSGLIRTRDGELSFPPGATGQGVIGGMYTSAGATMPEADLFCGWRVHLGTTPNLYPWGPSGQETASGVTLNLSHHYVLRRTFEVDRPIRNQMSYQTSANSSVQTFDADPGADASCYITWMLDEIVDDDPANVFTVSTTVLRKKYDNITDFVLYCPVVSYNLHAVLNYVEIFRPQQVNVLVNDVPIVVGNALDGARCAITTESGASRLAWYATPLPSQASRSGLTATDVVTIPPPGAMVEVQYWRSDVAIARVTNAASIALERQRFSGSGSRQQIVHAGDLKPIPNTSEECQALAQALIADQAEPRYEGTYAFETSEGNPTELCYMPLPGDLIPVSVTLPDTTIISQSLPVSRVETALTGRGCYAITLTFGALSREREAIRQLVLKRASTLDDPSIADVEAIANDNLTALSPPIDPSVSIDSITATAFSVTLLASGYVGFEVRTDDTGWGQPNYVTRFSPATHTFARSQRDQSYYIRPYNASGIYSRRSAFVRVQHPLPNTIAITTVDGVISPTTVEVNITLPNNPDLAGVLVRDTNSSGTLLYQGDGVITLSQAAGVNAIAGTGRLTVRIPNASSARSYNVWIAPYDLLGTFGTPTTFSITKPSPAVSSVTTTGDPNIWKWGTTNVGDGDLADLTLFDGLGNILKSYTVPAKQSYLSVGAGYTTQHLDVSVRDQWGSSSSGSTRSSDNGVPPQPGITVAVNVDSASPNGGTFFGVYWDFLYAGAGHVNMDSADQLVLQYSPNSLFTTPSTITEIPLSPVANGYTQVNAPLAAFFFRIRAHNAFGWSAWSNVTLATTGSALDALAPGGVYNFNAPALHTAITLGTSGYSVANANDGTGRSLTGLNSGGFVSQDLINAIKQKDNAGISRTLINANNNVNSLLNGTTIEGYSFRARDGLNGSGFVALNLPFPILQFDGAGTPRVLINGSQPVSALLDGPTITGYANRAGTGLDSSGFITRSLPFSISQFDGGGTLRTILNNSYGVSSLADGTTVVAYSNRAGAGLDGNGFLASRILPGVAMYNPGGGLNNIFLTNYHNLDYVNDSGSYVRTSYVERDGANRGYSGFNGSCQIVVGLSSGYGALGVNDMADSVFRAFGSIDFGGSRITTDHVDGYSIRYSVVSVFNITSNSLGAMAPGVTQGDDFRYI